MFKQLSTNDTTTWIDDLITETIEQHDDTTYIKNIYFSPGEIWNTVRKLPNKHAPDSDDIPT